MPESPLPFAVSHGLVTPNAHEMLSTNSSYTAPASLAAPEKSPRAPGFASSSNVKDTFTFPSNLARASVGSSVRTRRATSFGAGAEFQGFSSCAKLGCGGRCVCGVPYNHSFQRTRRMNRFGSLRSATLVVRRAAELKIR